MLSSSKRSILVTAYAKAPQGTAMYEVYKHAGVVLEVDPDTGTIIDAEFTLVTNLANSFFKRLVVGHNLQGGFEKLLDDIREFYFAPSNLAVVSALRGAHLRFMESREKSESGPKNGTNR